MSVNRLLLPVLLAACDRPDTSTLRGFWEVHEAMRCADTVCTIGRGTHDEAWEGYEADAIEACELSQASYGLQQGIGATYVGCTLRQEEAQACLDALSDFYATCDDRPAYPEQACLPTTVMDCPNPG